MKQKWSVLKEVNNCNRFSRQCIVIGQDLLNSGRKRTRKLCKMLFNLKVQFIIIPFFIK